MSGGAFDYAQYRIDDIVGRIEAEIEAAEKPRPELLTGHGVNVREKIGEGHWSYSTYGFVRFKTFEEADRYFSSSAQYRELERKEENGERKLVVRNLYDDTVHEVYTYTFQYYPPDEDGNEPYYPDYSKETLAEFRTAVSLLKRASVYTQRIDWLLSGDDGEESFHSRLKEELERLEEKE